MRSAAIPGRSNCASTNSSTIAPAPTIAMRRALPTVRASQDASLRNSPGRVAQLVRAPRLHRGGRPFESGRAHPSTSCKADRGADLRRFRASAPTLNVMPAESPIRVAVVGSGPAGFYAAGHLLKGSAGPVEVDMLERLPTPWGLVRSGVAPDHPKIKSVSRVYEKTAEHPRFRFFGNVTLGEHVSREELLAHYHALVYATGSPVDRPLGIPGENLPGSHTATEFVGWYNGHPDYQDREFDFSRSTAVVVGQGNVAADVARILATPVDCLRGTDICEAALETLAESRIRNIHII